MNCSVSLFNNQYLSLHIKKSNYSDEIFNIIKYHMKTSQIIITQLSHTKKGFNTNYTDSSIALRLLSFTHRSLLPALYHYRAYTSTLVTNATPGIHTGLPL